MPIKTEIVVNDGVGWMTARQHPIGRNADIMLAVTWHVRLLQPGKR